MTFVKQTLKNTASLLLAVWIIGTAYAAISTVSSGDPLTADSWNAIVNKLNNTDTNSTDLVTKSYVDSAVSASGNSSGSIDWSDCNYQSTCPESQYSGSETITCASWYALVDHSCMWASHQYSSYARCYLNWVNSLYVSSYSNWSTRACWSIKCCRVNP
jgi:hypothetical protein